MSLTRFRSYQPGEKPYSRRRTEEEWEPYHLLLNEMHDQRYTRKEMLVKLKEVGFDVSAGQLLSQLKKWNMMVYGERVSHSGTHQPDFDHIPCQGFLEPAIVDEPLSSEPPLPTKQYSLEGVSPAPLILHDTPISHTRQFSADQSLDTISDAISFSTLDDIQDLPTEGKSCETEEPVGPPPYHPEVSIPGPVVHALGSDAADPSSILRQIQTIKEPWCGNFPTACCCQALFRGQDGFKSSPELYKIILEQSSPHSLKYVVALLNLVETGSLGEDKEELRMHFWDTVNRYLQLCTRLDLKNKLAPHILHRLLKVWETFSDGDRLPFPTTDLFRSSVANTHEALIDKILRTKPTRSSQPPPYDYHVNWQIDAERDVGCVVGFAVRQPSTFPLLNTAGEIFGSIEPWSSVNGRFDQFRSVAQLIPTANYIAAYMQSQWFNGVAIVTAHDLGDCDIPLIFTALGLMIALETTAFTSEVDFSHPDSWTPGLRAFIETTVNTLSLNADYADKFRKAYWLVRCNTIGRTGKTVHMGQPCTATRDWDLLDRNINDYDEERTWLERRFFSGRNNSWPQADDLTKGSDDNMSIRSGNSFNSYRRFQALALHLRIGSLKSGSLKTKSSSNQSRCSSLSHMSWQLERMLHIRDGESEEGVLQVGEEVQCEADDVSSVEERAKMDELAYEKIQATVDQ